jgi:hypothetical protein
MGNEAFVTDYDLFIWMGIGMRRICELIPIFKFTRMSKFAADPAPSAIAFKDEVVLVFF